MNHLKETFEGGQNLFLDASSSKNVIALPIAAGDRIISNSIDKIVAICKRDATNLRLLKAAITELQYLFIRLFIEIDRQDVLAAHEIKVINQLPEFIETQGTVDLTLDNISKELNILPHRLELGCELIFNCALTFLIENFKIENSSNSFENR